MNIPAAAPAQGRIITVWQAQPDDVPSRIWLEHWHALASWWSAPPTSTRYITILNWLYLAWTLFWLAGFLSVARQPRLHGGKNLPDTKEDLTYWRRLLTTVVLWTVRGVRK